MSLFSILRGYSAAVFTCSLLALLSWAHPVQASSPDAWKEFQQSVKKACSRASSGVIKVKSIQVDPYGSESYGFAVLFGTEVGTSSNRLIVCAYDKVSKVAEISGPFKP